MDPHEIEPTENLLRVRADAWVMDILRIPQPDWVMLHFESTRNPLLRSIRVLLFRTEFRDLLARLDECLKAARTNSPVEPNLDPKYLRTMVACGGGFGPVLNQENTGILVVGYDLRRGQEGVEVSVLAQDGDEFPTFLWSPAEAEPLLVRLHELRARLFPSP